MANEYIHDLTKLVAADVDNTTDKMAIEDDTTSTDLKYITVADLKTVITGSPITVEKVQAEDGDGLYLFEDSGVKGIHVQDDGDVLVTAGNVFLLQSKGIYLSGDGDTNTGLKSDGSDNLLLFANNGSANLTITAADATFSADVHITDQLWVRGNATFDANVTIATDATIGADVYVGDQLFVHGNATIDGNVYLGGDVEVGGALSWGSVSIGSTDIENFAITASHFHSKIPILESDTWTDDSPSGGFVEWNEHTLTYDATTYTIVTGSTNSTYIYWKKVTSTTVYQTSNDAPVRDDETFVICMNNSGTHNVAWNSIANQVIGSAYILDAAIIEAKIDNLAVTNAKINTMEAGKLTAGTIDASVITVTNLNASNISTGVLTGRTVQTAASGQRIVLDQSDNTLRFYDASENNVVLIDDTVFNALPGILVNDSSGGVVCTQRDTYDYMYLSGDLLGIRANSDKTVIRGAYGAGNQLKFQFTSLGNFETYGAVSIGTADTSRALNINGSVGINGTFFGGDLAITSNATIDGNVYIGGTLTAGAITGHVIGTNIQAQSGILQGLHDDITLPDTGKIIEKTGVAAFSLVTITTAGKAILDDANAGAQRTTLGLAIGTNIIAKSTFDTHVADNDVHPPALSGNTLKFVRCNSGETALEFAVGAIVEHDNTYHSTNYQAEDAELTGLAGLSSTGITVHTGAGTFTERTIAVGEGLDISNGNGVSGNPTLSAELATTSNKGVASFNTTDFSVVDGFVTARDTGISHDGIADVSTNDHHAQSHNNTYHSTNYATASAFNTLATAFENHEFVGGNVHADATTSVHGFMTDTQFDKLAGIESSADKTDATNVAAAGAAMAGGAVSFTTLTATTSIILGEDDRLYMDGGTNDYILYDRAGSDASERFEFRLGGVCRFYISRTGGHDGAP